MRTKPLTNSDASVRDMKIKHGNFSREVKEVQEQCSLNSCGRSNFRERKGKQLLFPSYSAPLLEVEGICIIKCFSISGDR